MEGFASRPVWIQTAVMMSTVSLVREFSGVVLTIVDCEEGAIVCQWSVKSCALCCIPVPPLIA